MGFKYQARHYSHTLRVTHDRILRHSKHCTGTGIHFLNEGLGINRYNYAAGYFLTAFDLTPDLSAHCNSHWNFVRSGSVRIEVGFETAPTVTINCIVYAEYDNILEIGSTRKILTDFSA